MDREQSTKTIRTAQLPTPSSATPYASVQRGQHESAIPILVCIAAAASVITEFLPWRTIGNVTFNGVDRGSPLLIVLSVAAFAGMAYRAAHPEKSWTAWFAVVSLGIITIVAGADLNNATQLQKLGLNDANNVGWGLYATLSIAAVGALMSILTFFVKNNADQSDDLGYVNNVT